MYWYKIEWQHNTSKSAICCSRLITSWLLLNQVWYVCNFCHIGCTNKFDLSNSRGDSGLFECYSFKARNCLFYKTLFVFQSVHFFTWILIIQLIKPHLKRNCLFYKTLLVLCIGRFAIQQTCYVISIGILYNIHTGYLQIILV